MKFNEYIYRRPNLDKIETSLKSVIAKFVSSNSLKEQVILIDRVNVIRNNYDSMKTLCEIRNTINTTDEFYESEIEWFNNNDPIYDSYMQEFLKVLVKSPFRSQLEEKYGAQWFRLVEAKLKTFDPVIIEDLQVENHLVTKYQKLKASAKIEFNGEVCNLAQLTPYANSKDRNVRIKAENAICAFYEEHENEFDEIYDRLVHVRDTIAKKLGFKNFVELGYYRMSRTDYNSEMVANYRLQVEKDLVPTVCDLVDKRSKYLGLDKMMSYDLGVFFKDGNPKPKGDTEYKTQKALEMYSEMSLETKEFFEFMVEHQLLDLDAKPSKALGGYCTSIPDYKSPFIFANFNGTNGDIEVLTHEGGHAFQTYLTMKTQTLPDYMFPTYEACEIHSMSMEFFAWPWMKLFFEDDTDKFYYQHLADSIMFIPYGVSVDEFQHRVYESPDMTPDERKAVWREIEMKYTPYKVYENDFLNRGGYWFRQGHIFESPFYYIDYTLAQVCAHQFWIKDHQDHETAWKDYYNLCVVGGSKSFLELLEIANLKNPFVDGTIKATIIPLKEWLDSIDLNKLK